MSTCAANTRAAARAQKFWRTLTNRGARRIATLEDLTQAFWANWIPQTWRINLIIAGTTMAHCAKVWSRPCRAWNLKDYLMVLKRSCAKWAKEFFPVRHRWIHIAKASRR